MNDDFADGPVFATWTMAEILLSQDQVEEARQVAALIDEERPDDPRSRELISRIEERAARGEMAQRPGDQRGEDRVALTRSGDGPIVLSWELSDAGLALARRSVRFSGDAVVRLFHAAPGPRGVRKISRDIRLEHAAGWLLLSGLPRPSALAAAAGYLSHTGVFLPLACSGTLMVRP